MKKAWPILLLLILLFCVFTACGGRRSHSEDRPYPSKSYYTSGYPKHRSSAAKREFLRMHGYKRTPKGYQVDHIIPLAEGGKDEPSNMQLLTIEEHKAKTAKESRKYEWNRGNYPGKRYKIK